MADEFFTEVDSDPVEQTGHRRFCFTLNADVLKLHLSTYKPSPSILLEGKFEVMLGSLEPAEEDKTDPYAHYHVAVRNKKGAMTKKTAVGILARALQLPAHLFKTGVDASTTLLTYAQPMKREWETYLTYAFKHSPALIGGIAKSSDTKDKVVANIAKEFYLKNRKRPTERQIMKRIVADYGSSAGVRYDKIVKVFCQYADVDEDIESPVSEEEQGPPAKKICRDLLTVMSTGTSFDAHLNLKRLFAAMKYTSQMSESAVMAQVLLPMLTSRHPKDHSSKCLFMFGDAGTGKSFWPRLLQKHGWLQNVPMDASGVARFELPQGRRGWLIDECTNKWFCSHDNINTLKQLCDGGEASVKVFGTTVSVSGWLIFTSNESSIPKGCENKMCTDCPKCNSIQRRMLPVRFVSDQFEVPDAVLKCDDIDLTVDSAYKMVLSFVAGYLPSDNYYYKVIREQFCSLGLATFDTRRMSCVDLFL